MFDMGFKHDVEVIVSNNLICQLPKGIHWYGIRILEQKDETGQSIFCCCCNFCLFFIKKQNSLLVDRYTNSIITIPVYKSPIIKRPRVAKLSYKELCNELNKLNNPSTFSL